MIEILKKDEKFFINNMNHTNLTEYYKTKDNSLRIGIFENKEFIAIETNKAEGVFKQAVLDQDNSYVVKNKQTILKKDGTVDHIKYFGTKN